MFVASQVPPPPPPPHRRPMVLAIAAASVASLSVYQATKENVTSPYHPLSAMVRRACNID